MIGHGNLMASPEFAELNVLAGQAARRCETNEALKFLAHVFWFTIEFGVLWEDGELRAYGAGILSSYGEIEEFREMEIRPIDFLEMGTIDYDITKYQPVLYSAGSMTELVDSLGSFFAELRRRDAGAAGTKQKRSCPIIGPSQTSSTRSSSQTCPGSRR